MDRGAWRATVQRVAQSQTWLKWLSTRAIWKHGEGWLTFSSCPPPIVRLWNLAITLHLEHISVQTSPSSDACVAGGSSLGRHRSQSGLNTSGDRALTPSWTFTPSPQTLSWELPPGQPGRTQHHCLHFRAGWHPLQGIKQNLLKTLIQKLLSLKKKKKRHVYFDSKCVWGAWASNNWRILLYVIIIMSGYRPTGVNDCKQGTPISNFIN